MSEKARERQRRYREVNREAIRKRDRDQKRERYASDPEYRERKLEQNAAYKATLAGAIAQTRAEQNRRAGERRRLLESYGEEAS